MRQLQNQLASRFPSLSFVLLLFLLLFIETTCTIIGRAYYHLIDLHADTLKTNSLKSLLVATLVVPFFIWVTTKRSSNRSTSWFLMIHLGLWMWFTGATISTWAHDQNPVVVLNYAAGIGSALAVFYAVRRVNLTNSLYLEAVFAAVALGGFALAARCIIGYYQKWGIPSFRFAFFDARLDTKTWLQISLGNSGNSSVFFGLLASSCLAIVFLKLFTRATRWLAWVSLICASVTLLLCMSRTGLILFAFSGVLVSVFVRNRNALFCSVALVVVLILVLPPGPGASILLGPARLQHVSAPIHARSASGAGRASADRSRFDMGHVNAWERFRNSWFSRMLRYDLTSDHSAAERVDSIRVSWREFIAHPFVGLGADQSPTVVKQGNAHELAIWQATEHGILGFLGVLVVTGACIARLFRLLQAGAATSQRLRVEFLFLLGPTMYFIRGLVLDAALNNTVVNTWICLTFAMLAIADAVTMDPAGAGREPATMCEGLQRRAQISGSKLVLVMNQVLRNARY